MNQLKIVFAITAFLTFLAGIPQAYSAATLLPNGEQCFSATTPTSGGLYGPITTLGTITGGSSYVSATYTNVPLTGGSGFGAIATITVTGGVVTSVTITNPGSHYTGADTLSAAAANLGGSGSGFSVPVIGTSTTGTGMLGLLATITGGSGGTAGTYPGVAFTGGSGTGGTATFTVSGGAVTAVTILNPGTGYQVGDILSAASGNVGGVSGFSVPVSSVSINQSLAGGSVYFYYPNTNTTKQTWQNQAQTVLNTNPVTLDANGCATIYGTGSYRQVVQDALGNTVWDKITTDTSANNNSFYAGVAGGTPNAILLADSGFNATDGSVINFLPLATNTGATTISVVSSPYTNIPVVKDTTGGPEPLTGGEIVAGPPQNVVSVLYSALQNNFHLLNTAIAGVSGATAPLCGAQGLKITNGSPSGSVISLTANQVVTQTTSGLVVNRSNVSLTNISLSLGTATPTANGMDGESPTAGDWLYVWAIDNGAAAAGLISIASGNGLNPVLPSGYGYKCRLGAMLVNGSGALDNTLQYGADSQWLVQPSGALPVITSSFGTFWTAVSVSSVVPPTATHIKTALESSYSADTNSTGSVSGSIGLAPNANYGEPAASGRPPCGQFFSQDNTNNAITTGQSFDEICDLLLESTNVYTGVATTASGTSTLTISGTLSAFGWHDNVNAN